ncbi:MAG: hypothetical protein R3F62_22380 [Planctomycetota bacterium]
MNCAEFRDLLSPFLDSELEVDQNVACLKHVELCAPCARRVSDERQLHTRLVDAIQHPLTPEARAGLLAGVFARVEAEDASPPPPAAPHNGRWLLALTLLAALVAGGAWFVRSDPLCLWGCSTHDLLLQAQVRMQEPPRPLDEVEQEIHRTVDYPELVGGRVSGCQTLVSEGCPCHPLVRFTLPDSNEICYVSLPGGHAHVGSERELPDGRRYVVGDGELRFVGWKCGDGSLKVCMPTPCSKLTDSKLFLLAAALRGS